MNKFVRFTYRITGIALMVLLAPFVLAGVFIGFIWVGLQLGMSMTHDSITTLFRGLTHMSSPEGPSARGKIDLWEDDK